MSEADRPEIRELTDEEKHLPKLGYSQDLHRSWFGVTRDQKFLVYLSGFAVILIVALAMFIGGHAASAAIWSTTATIAWVFGVGGYVVYFDSRRRWPGSTPSQRLYALLTFSRPTHTHKGNRS